MSLNESIVEAAALEWFGELGYTVGHGPQLAPGEPAAERASFSEVVLVGRLREAIRRLNPAIHEEARATLANSATVRIERRLQP
jgi:type I restriction enzyme R subunit